MESLGFGPDELARLRPGIISVSISAYGTAGPWHGRRGFDSVIQSANGTAHEVAGADGVPHALPANPLDYTTGYLAAFGVLAALGRRAREGGSYHVELSLAQTGEYLSGLTRADPALVAGRAPDLPAAPARRADAHQGHGIRHAALFRARRPDDRHAAALGPADRAAGQRPAGMGVTRHAKTIIQPTGSCREMTETPTTGSYSAEMASMCALRCNKVCW